MRSRCLGLAQNPGNSGGRDTGIAGRLAIHRQSRDLSGWCAARTSRPLSSGVWFALRDKSDNNNNGAHNGGHDAQHSPLSPQHSQICSARLGCCHCGALCQGQLRRRIVVAWESGTIGCPAPTIRSPACATSGVQKTTARSKIDYITSQGEKDQIDGGRRSASRYRPRHHVPSRLEHPHPRRGARTAERRRRYAHQTIRADQPRRRISLLTSRAHGAAFLPPWEAR